MIDGWKIPGLKAGAKYVLRVIAVVTLLWFSCAGPGLAQKYSFRPVDLNDSVYRVSGKKLILPATLIGFGFAQFSVPSLTDLNLAVRSGVHGLTNKPFRIDNFSLYAPAVAVYGLNLFGVKGKHDFWDRSVILATSLAVMGASVEGIKLLTHIQRPDGTTFNSFPSGHTATAFACAEFLYQEYKDVSVWYGIAGYTIAAGTGFLRMYNNRHWFTDVVAGAGFGILSTRLAYWAFPKVSRLVYKTLKLKVSIVPQPIPLYGQIR